MLPEETLQTCVVIGGSRFVINLDTMDLISPLSFAQSWRHSRSMKGPLGRKVIGERGGKNVSPDDDSTWNPPTQCTQQQICTYLRIFIQCRVMTRFRPCIDLHSGQVKQIVGGTLSAQDSELKTNYVSKLPSSHYAQLYKNNALSGAHVIMLGPGNEVAAQEALSAWPGALQLGGGINDTNAKQWIEKGAEKVILSSLRDAIFFRLRSLGRSL